MMATLLRPVSVRAPGRGAARRRVWRWVWRPALVRFAASQPAEPAAHTARPRRAQAGEGSIGAGSLGDECERFIRQHERPILNYLWRMTGNEQAAYDLAQEVFLRAWQRFPTISRYEQPRGWLFRVATNLALTYLRRHTTPSASATSLDPTRDAAHDPAASDPARRVAETDQVRRVLLQLTPKRRAALVLREVYGLSCAEVAATLAMSGPSVRMALHRAREQFRDLYTLAEGDR